METKFVYIKSEPGFWTTTNLHIYEGSRYTAEVSAEEFATDDEAKLKAEQIVRACNSYDNMLKACLMALGYATETSVLYNTLKTAIAEAEKGE